MLALPLSVYGGFFTGGYATLLTYLFVLVMGLSFLESVAATRIMSVFSAAFASVVLGSRGLIDFSLGLPLAMAYTMGAVLGARLALRRGNRWLRAVFITAAIGLSLRLVIVELRGALGG
jgi:hypothetical protein